MRWRNGDALTCHVTWLINWRSEKTSFLENTQLIHHSTTYEFQWISSTKILHQLLNYYYGYILQRTFLNNILYLKILILRWYVRMEMVVNPYTVELTLCSGQKHFQMTLFFVMKTGKLISLAVFYNQLLVIIKIFTLVSSLLQNFMYIRPEFWGIFEILLTRLTY